MAISAGSAYVSILPDLSKFASGLSGGVNSALKKAEGQTKGFLGGLSRGASQVGSVLTKAVTVPLLGIGAVAVSTALKFDDAFTRIGALSDVTTKQLGEMRTGVLALAGQTAKSPQELADALYFLASAGLNANQIMPALGAAAKASAVGLGETADIAKITAQAMNTYAKSGLTATQVTDTLVAAVKAGTADPNEFASALGRILPIAAKAKVSFSEVTASLSALSNVGLDVNEGVTAMRGVLLALEAPGSQAAKTLKDVGISTDEMRKSIADDGLLGALRLLDKATGGNIDTMRKIIPNVRSLTGEFALLGQNGKKVDQIFHDVTHASGPLDEALTTTEQGPMFKFRQGLARLQVVGIKMGEKLLPIVLKVVDFVSRMADKFNNLSPAMQSNIIKWGLIAAVAGPAIRILGGAIGVVGRLGSALFGLGKKLGTAALAKDAFSKNVGGTFVPAVGKGVAASQGFIATMGGWARVLGVAGLAYFAFSDDVSNATKDWLGAIKDSESAAGAAIVRFGADSDQGRKAILDMANAMRADGSAAFKTYEEAVANFKREFGKLPDVVNQADAAHRKWLTTLGVLPSSMHDVTQALSNAQGVTQKQEETIVRLWGQTDHLGVSLSQLRKNEIQAALHAGNFTLAQKLLNGVIARGKREVDAASGAQSKNARTAEEMANKLRLAGLAASGATGKVKGTGSAAHVTAGQLAGAARQAYLLKQRLDGLKSKTITLTFDINTRGHIPGGGDVRFARGGPITEPIVGVGQRTGTKYTFGEEGPEDVVPRGRGTVHAPASPSGVTGGLTEDEAFRAFKRALWEMREVIGSKPPVVMIGRRQLAQAVEADALWSR